jgi:hypothetical protein
LREKEKDPNSAMTASYGRIRTGLISLFFIALVAEADAAFRYSNNGGKITITGYDGPPAGTLVIPDRIDGFPVTEIGDEAFSNSWGNHDLLTGVTIPATVTRIGGWAFFSCHGIKQMTLPASLTQIGAGAFSFGGLSSVSIPQNVTLIGNMAFSDCRSLTAINVHSSNPSYSSASGVLYNKNRTTLIRHPQAKGGAFVIPSTVTTIAQSAFASSTALTAVTIPSGVTTIGSEAFSSCSRLTEVAIPANVTSIGSGAFRDCLGMTAIHVDPANPAYRSVDGVLFNHNQSTLIQCPTGRTGGFVIPPGCTIIGDSAFAGCAGLASVTIPAGVGTIGARAFENCTGLGSAGLPAGVTMIGQYAFSGCSSLWEMEIPSGITTIRPYTFSRCASLASIVIPDTVTSIQNGAFSQCVSLLEVVIPPGVPTLGESAFSSCVSLTIVTLPNGLTSIGTSAFSNCRSLQSISIPQSVTTLGSSAFGSCSQLMDIHVDAGNPSFSSVNGVLFNKAQTTLLQFPSGRAGAYEIPAGITGIGNSAFASCRLLVHVTMGGDVVSIGSNAFSYCRALSGITPGPAVTSIGSAAFSYCKALAQITIGPSVTSIGSSAFSNCDSLAAIDVDPANASFSSLGGVLYNKTQTTLIQCPAGLAGTLTIPPSVTTIVTTALSGSQNLAAIDVDPANSAFSSIDGMLFNKTQTTLIRCPLGKSGTVQIPASVTNINPSAFSGCPDLTDFQVAALNPAYSSLDGLLYNKTGTTLFKYPPAKSGAATLSAIVTGIADGAFDRCRFLTAIHVDPGNLMFASDDGVLFNKSLTLLIQYPGGRQGYAFIPASVISLGLSAFDGRDDLAGLVFFGNAPSSIYFSFDTSVPIQHFDGAIGFLSPWNWPTVLNLGAVSPVRLWLLENVFPYATNLALDNNGDGVSLLMAYALNLDPRSNLASSMPRAGLEGGWLSITYHAARAGITYRVETSNDLTTWTTEGVLVSAPDSNGIRTASVPAPDAARYLRLAVSE